MALVLNSPQQPKNKKNIVLLMYNKATITQLGICKVKLEHNNKQTCVILCSPGICSGFARHARHRHSRCPNNQLQH